MATIISYILYHDRTVERTCKLLYKDKMQPTRIISLRYEIYLKKKKEVGRCGLTTPRWCLATFLGDGAELLLQFDVVAGTLHAVCQPGHRRLEVHQLGTQVGVGGVEADRGHAGRQRDLVGDEEEEEWVRPLSVCLSDCPKAP